MYNKEHMAPYICFAALFLFLFLLCLYDLDMKSCVRVSLTSLAYVLKV